jgi:membrane protein implicated in regulation of membrane protease activity
MNSTAPHLTPAATQSPPRRPSAAEKFADVATPLAAAPAFYGPPVLFLFGPWLLLGLVLVPWVGPLIALALVLVLAVVLLAVLIVSPFLLVRHLRARHAARLRWDASVRRTAVVRQPIKGAAPWPLTK